MKKAITIIACERNLYLKQCIDSVLKNDLSDWDIIVSVDGSKYAEYFKTLIDAEFIVHEKPVGTARHIIGLKSELFKKYDVLLQLEDDIIVADNFVSVTWNLLQWGLLNFDNVGAATASSYLVTSVDTKKNELGRVEATTYGGSTSAMTRSCWKSIESTLYEYLQLIPEEYKDRDDLKIHEWMVSKGEKRKQFPHLVTKEWYSNLQNLCSSQDRAHAVAMHEQGLVSIHTVINYTKNIGKYGAHTNPETFILNQFDRIELDYTPTPAYFYL
jgi:glycosyltransferase involved in cell wall biosynthesis